MFFSIFIRVLRAWEDHNNLVGLAIYSPARHTETCVLLDDAGSAFQIAVDATGVSFRPQVMVTEYVSETMNVLHQESFTSSLFTLPPD
jgi:hypothetical protein